MRHGYCALSIFAACVALASSGKPAARGRLNCHPRATSLVSLSPLIAEQLKEGDVIGVALDFTDLPMLFFSRGGEPLGQGDELAVMRIRGTVYPAFGVGGGAALSVTFAGESLAQTPPRKCEALIVGQDMM